MRKIYKTDSQNLSVFTRKFKSEILVISPGRINLIGEHTDYNQGFVLPTAIDKNIHLNFRVNNSPSTCRIYSDKYSSSMTFDLFNLEKRKEPWENYILGVIDEILKKGKSLNGFDCYIESKLSVGAGISSSAALECGLAAGLNELFGLNFSKMDIVKLSQKAENNFVGSNCGIMDQFASVMSRKGNFILLDCRSVTANYIPTNFGCCKLLLLNTNISRNLAEGEYNSRRRDCEQAVSIIKIKYPFVKSIRDIDMNMLEEFKTDLSSKLYKRVLYVIKENKRVLLATDAISSGDLKKCGELMYLSHQGLKDQYEVSCPELDFLVEFSKEKKFIYGSRMMGGGFGGCTINLIEEQYVQEYTKEVTAAYRKKFKIELDAITVEPSEGTRVRILKGI